MISADVGGSALTIEKSFSVQDDMRALMEPMRMPTLLPAAPVDASQAIVRICEKAGVPHDVQASGILVPALLFEANTGWEAIQDVAEKTLGAAWMSETGTIVYRNAATMRGVGTPVESILSLDSVEDVAWSYSDENVADRQTVTYTPFVTTTVTDNSLTIWESQKVMEIEPGATVVLEQDFEGAADSLAPWRQAQDTTVPAEQYSRWNAAFSPDGGDAPPASVLTVTTTLLSASRVKITLKSNAAQKLYVADFGYQSLIVRANKTVRPGAPVTLESGNTEETARNTVSLDLGLYAGTEAKAKELLGWLALQSATPRAQLDGLRVVPDAARRLGSLVTFTDPVTGASSRCIITRKEDSGSAATYDQHLTLTMVPGTTPPPATVVVKITEPIGTSDSTTLTERQAFRDANADRIDQTAPPAPSAPILSARLGVITVGFDGRANTGSELPSRVEYVQVALSGAPNANAVVNTIPGAGGQILISDQPYNSTRHIRLRAISYAGVAGPWGAERTITVTPLVDTDMIGKVIGSANITDGAVTEVTIASSAITAAKIAVDAITADKLLDGAVLSSKIAANAITGAKLANSAVDATKLAPGAVTDAALATPVKNAITGAQTAADNAQTAANSAQASANAAAADLLALSGKTGRLIRSTTAPTGDDRNVNNLWLNTNNGQLSQWTGSAWTVITDSRLTAAAQAAADADSKAGLAQSAATAAQSAASAAQTAANAAQTTADGKSKVTRATTDPIGAGSAGDQWWKYSGSQIVGLWIHSGSGWVSQTLTDAVITNLNAGTITAGFLAAARIQAATITGTHIAGGTVTAANMVAGTITAASGILADASITTAKIADLAVSGAKIANATITNAKISDLDAVKINAGTLNAARIAAESITAEKLAANSVTTAKLVAEAVTSAKIAALAVEAGHIKANAITADKIAAGAITVAKLNVGDFENFAEHVPAQGIGVVYPTEFTTATDGEWITNEPASQRGYLMFRNRRGPIPFKPGEQIRVQFTGMTTTPGSGYVQVNMWCYPSSTSSTGNISSNQVGLTLTEAPTEFSAVLTVPDISSFPNTSAWLVGLSGANAQYAKVKNIRVYRMTPGELIVNGAITADKIAFGVLESDHTPGVPAVRIGGQGVRLYDTEGNESVSLTATGSQFLTLKDSTGEPVASIDDTGGSAFETLAVAGEARVDGVLIIGGDPIAEHGSGDYGPVINGRDLLGKTFTDYVNEHPGVQDGNAWLTAMPHGQILNAWHENGTTAETYDGINGESHFRQKLQGSFEAKAGRIYQIAYRTPSFRETGTLGTGGNVGACILYYSTGTTPLNVTGSIIRGTRAYFPRGGSDTMASVVTTVRCPEDIPAGQINLGITVYAYSGRTMQSQTTSDQNRYELAVTDMGMRAPSNQGVSVNLSRQGTVDPTPPTPPAPAKKEYTTTVNASWGQGYKGDNTQNSDAGAKATQGYTSYWPSGGVQRGLIGFPSVTGTLSGADIVKVEVYVYAAHWASSSGGTLCIGGHSHTSKPTTWSSNLNDAKRQALKKPEGRWITLPSSMHAGFKSGTYRGISLLPPGSSTSSTYYGYLTWSKSKLRITYKK